MSRKTVELSLQDVDTEFELTNIQINPDSNRKGSSSLKLFILLITLVPLLIAFVFLTITIGIIVLTYFRLIINNLGDLVVYEVSSNDKTILELINSYVSARYNFQFDEVLIVKDLLLDHKNEAESLQKMKDSIIAGNTTCWSLQQIKNTIPSILPPCIDLVESTETSFSNDIFKLDNSGTFGLINCNMIVKGDRRPFKEWKNEQLSTLASLLALSPFLVGIFGLDSLKGTSENLLSEHFMYIASSNSGIISYNNVSLSFFAKQKLQISRSDCPPGIYDDLPGNPASIYYDPRCRTWFKSTIQFLTEYARINNITTIKMDEMSYPLITSPYYAQLDFTERITVCSADEFSVFDTWKNRTTNIVCKDFYMQRLVEEMSVALSSILSQFLSLLENTPTISSLLNELETINISKEQYPYTAWCRKVREPYPDFDFIIFRLDEKMKYSPLINLSGFITTTNNSEVDNLMSRLSPNSNFSNILQEVDMTFYKDGLTNQTVRVKISSIIIPNSYSRKQIEIFKMVMFIPEYLINKKYSLEIDATQKSIYLSSGVLLVCSVVLLAFGACCIEKYGRVICNELEIIIDLMQNINSDQRRKIASFTSNNWHQWSSWDTENTFYALINLNKILSEVIQLDNGEKNDAILNYSHRIRVFKILRAHRLLGVAYNNFGCHHFKTKNYRTAVNIFQESIEQIEELYDQSVFHSSNYKKMEEDEYFKIKTGRMMNLLITYWKMIDDDKFKGLVSIFEIDHAKSIADEILLKDGGKDANYWRQAIVLCIKAELERSSGLIGNSISTLERANKIYLQLEEEDNAPIPKFYVFQEIMFQKILHYYAQGKFKRACNATIKAFTTTRFFDKSQRRRLISLTTSIFRSGRLNPTMGFIEIQKMHTSKRVVRAYLLALDYSGSMAIGNKLQNAIRVLLRLWDSYIQQGDLVAFYRFNLQVEKVFPFGPKSLNQFSRRHLIECSLSPSERTCLFDLIITACLSFANIEERRILIVICDSVGSNSLHTIDEAIYNLQRFKIQIVVFGLKLQRNDRKIIKKIIRDGHQGIYVDLASEGDVWEIVLQNISGFEPGGEFVLLTYE